MRLAGGSVVISTNSITFPSEHRYGENEEFLKFFVLSYTKFLCDSPLENTSPKPLKVIMRFFKRLTSESIGLVVRELSGFAAAILLEENSTGVDSSIRVFHEFMIDTPVFKEYHMWLKTGRPELLRYVLSFLLFGKKLEYVDPQFDATAFRGWLEVEDMLDSLEFRKQDLDNLKSIVSYLLGPLDVDFLAPKFGPGRVSERGVADVFDKLRNLKSHPRLSYVFDRERPFRASDRGFGPLLVRTQGDISDSVSRLKFVPKDITKSRSICMEPNSFMYYQQEVLRYMRNTMASSPISMFVNMDDQTVNQRAAIHGSQYLSSDTIDLSSASDSVHIDLVKGVFPRDWLFYMLGTRTSSTYVPGSSEPRRLKKFAPMGSAICFPTQCILFTAVCLYAYLAVYRKMTTEQISVTTEMLEEFVASSLYRTRSANTPFKKKYEPPVVYGDDIIIDARASDEVIHTLSRLGFSVNRSKSFTSSQSFRESCGVYAYEGLDVTPMQFRIPFIKKGRWDAKTFASFIGGINKMKAAGLHSVATFWLTVLQDYGFKYPIPFQTDGVSFGIFTRNKKKPDERHLRWNADWQVHEERMLGIRAKRLESESPSQGVLDSYRFDLWWRSRIGKNSILLSERGLLVRPQETGIAPIWTRCEQ